MKRAHPMALMLALIIAPPLAVRGAEPPVPTPPSNAATVGEAHRRLADLAGLWRVKQSLWLIPGQSPQVDSGTAMFTPVLGGRHVQQDLRIASSPPFQGLGYTGYDNVSGAYYTSWMDINFTDVLVLRGDYDADRHAYRFHGEMTGESGQKIPTREELFILDAHHVVARYFETRHGQEALVVELDYSRP